MPQGDNTPKGCLTNISETEMVELYQSCITLRGPRRGERCVLEISLGFSNLLWAKPYLIPHASPLPPHLLPRRLSTLFPAASTWLPGSPLCGLYSQKARPRSHLIKSWVSSKHSQRVSDNVTSPSGVVSSEEKAFQSV